MIVADVKDISEKSQSAVVPLVVGVTLVSDPPVAVYVPEFETFSVGFVSPEISVPFRNHAYVAKGFWIFPSIV